MSDVKAIKTALIRIDGGTQIRERIDDDTVADYAEKMAGGAEFPPPVIFHDGSDFWLADGFHRVLGHVRNKAESVNCEVRKGSKRDAVVFACQANGTHGLRRTNADKRRAVTTLLELLTSEGKNPSNVEIAERCGVSDEFVSKIRASIIQRLDDAPETRTATRGGKSYEMKVKASSPRKAKTDPPADEPDATAEAAKPAKAEPDAKPDGPPWAAFESEVKELVGELTAIERKMMRVLDSHAAENKCRAPWSYFIPYSGTVGLVRQARKSLLDNLPAESASKHPGYISRKAVEQRDAVERQGRKSA